MEEQKPCVCKAMNICLGNLCWYITAYGLFHHGFMYRRQASCSQLEALEMEPCEVTQPVAVGICDEKNSAWHAYTITFLPKEARAACRLKNLTFDMIKETSTVPSDMDFSKNCCKEPTVFQSHLLAWWPKQAHKVRRSKNIFLCLAEN